MIALFHGAEAYFRSRPAHAPWGESSVRERVAAIVERVRLGGDRALLELTSELDGARLTAEEIRVSREEIVRAAGRASDEFRRVLASAAANIRRYHEKQLDKGFELRLEDGSTLAQRVTPLRSVGVYVPGGAASYPSSVLMNVVPARLAGVDRIVVATPLGAIERSCELAAAFVLLELDEVYRMGGAQAVAALAFGTESVRAVDKIVGPGNAYVAEAKRLVFGQVGIDTMAGPSEIVVLADESAEARYVAADLLSQAEHGSGDERAVLVTTSIVLAQEVAAEIGRQQESLPRKRAIGEVLRRNGAAVAVASLDEALSVVERIAPEHLEIMMRDAAQVAARVRNAGAIFIGEHSPVPVGDFYAGPNHVLPTGSAARFASALGVYDFVKRTSVVRYSRKRLDDHRRDIEAFARAEGFEAHARAIAIRFE
ncbi:MAG TPA: histidinol dehydrogenase [Vicinamibacteria bacterium]|nr:histidinol dehydrogenase [Vicinamibacteria bacterium]